MSAGRALSFFALLLLAPNLASAESPVVVHPESMAGPWEARMRSGVGSRYILMVARMETLPYQDVERLAVISVEIGVGLGNTGLTSGLGETGRPHVYEWRYTGWSNRADCEFDGTHLVVRASRAPDVPHDLEIDLTFDRDQAAWRGTFAQDGSAAEIRFERPHRDPGVSADALEGNWRSTSVRSLLCLHAWQKADGELVMWLDRRDDPGTYARSSYGAGVFRWWKSTEPSRVSLQTGENFGNGPDTFEGELSADGSRLEGYWRHPHLPAVRSVFVRTDGDSCHIK